MSAGKARTLEVVVTNIEGDCPVYSIGDHFIIRDGYVLDTVDSRVCMHSLSSIMPFYTALSRGIKPRELGLSRGGEDGSAFVQCLDPCRITGGGTVTFEIKIGE